MVLDLLGPRLAWRGIEEHWWQKKWKSNRVNPLRISKKVEGRLDIYLVAAVRRTQLDQAPTWHTTEEGIAKLSACSEKPRDSGLALFRQERSSIFYFEVAGTGVLPQSWTFAFEGSVRRWANLEDIANKRGRMCEKAVDLIDGKKGTEENRKKAWISEAGAVPRTGWYLKHALLFWFSPEFQTEEMAIWRTCDPDQTAIAAGREV
jgi:hypothetical protein